MKPPVITIAIAILGVTLLAGCSSTPSASEGRDVLEKQIQEQSKGMIKLLDFRKTDGQAGELMGVRVYAMDFEAEVEFQEDCYWGGPFGGFEVMTGEPGPFNAFMFMGKRKARAGERATISGKLQFQKTEKGWQGKIASTQVQSASSAEADQITESRNSKRDAAINDLNDLAARAYQFRLRPKQMRGGGGSYEGFDIPEGWPAGVRIVRVSADEIVFEKDGVQAFVDADGNATFK
jgi:hypothetical protein